MNKKDILNKLITVTHQPFMIFARDMDDKNDNTLATLKFLDEKEEVTAGMIAEFLDIKPSSVTQIIKKLEATGVARRVKSDSDARVTFVELTDKGRESLANRKTSSEDLLDGMFQDFSQEELEIFNSYLDRLTNNISSSEFFRNVETNFGDDKRWEHFGKMSARFAHAREQMMRGGFNSHSKKDRNMMDSEDFVDFMGTHQDMRNKDFDDNFGGFEDRMRGRR